MRSQANKLSKAEMNYRQKNEKKMLNLAKYEKKKEKKTFLELAKGFWRVKNTILAPATIT